MKQKLLLFLSVFVFWQTQLNAQCTFTVTATTGSILCNGGITTVTINATGGTAPYTGTGTVSVHAGTTTFSVTDANSCLAVESLTITQPASLTVNTTASAILCHGGLATVTVNATGGTMPYTGTGTVMAANGASSYTVTDANGCNSTANITLTEPAEIVSSKTLVLCAGESVTVGAFTYSATGFYVTGLHAINGCDSTVTLDLTVSPFINPIVSFNGNALVANQAGASYKWFHCDDNANQPIPGATSQTYTPTTNGDYAVIVTVGNCSDTSACFSFGGVGIKKYTTATNVKIYPNPGNGIFTVESLIAGKINMTDVLGHTVMNETLQAGKQSFNLENKPDGIYFIQFNTGDQQKIIRFIKE